MKKIGTEEHFWTQYFMDHLQARKKYPKADSVLDEKGEKTWRWWNSAEEYYSWLPDTTIRGLCNIDIRLKEMDEAGIDMLVLSFNGSINEFDAAEGIALTKRVNDIIAGIVREHPDRFVSFAGVFLKEPKAAADELERGVKELGFKGTMILPHVVGEYIDARKYWPLFERAAKLGVPVYIHPEFPPRERLKQYEGYPELVGGMWGYGAETGLAAVRLICSGIFDEYPGLQVILGHMGEALPYWIPRLDRSWSSGGRHTLLTNREIAAGADVRPLAEKIRKPPSYYMKNNFFMTISGMYWQPVLQLVCSAIGVDRVLFAIDSPFAPSKPAAQFIESVPIPEADKEKICHANIEKLLKL